MTISVANAPCSYGAFEVTVGIDPNVPDGVTLLDHVASAGYQGIDLGPVGYLGTGRELHDRLSGRGLVLVGMGTCRRRSRTRPRWRSRPATWTRCWTSSTPRPTARRRGPRWPMPAPRPAAPIRAAARPAAASGWT